MDIDEVFRANLKKLREEKDIDAKKLSKLAGLGERGVKDIEEGRSQSPKISTAARLAKALDQELPDMLGIKLKLNIHPDWLEFLLQYDESEQEQILAAVSLLPLAPPKLR